MIMNPIGTENRWIEKWKE